MARIPPRTNRNQRQTNEPRQEGLSEAHKRFIRQDISRQLKGGVRGSRGVVGGIIGGAGGLVGGLLRKIGGGIRGVFGFIKNTVVGVAGGIFRHTISLFKIGMGKLLEPFKGFFSAVGQIFKTLFSVFVWSKIIKFGNWLLDMGGPRQIFMTVKRNLINFVLDFKTGFLHIAGRAFGLIKDITLRTLSGLWNITLPTIWSHITGDGSGSLLRDFITAGRNEGESVFRDIINNQREQGGWWESTQNAIFTARQNRAQSNRAEFNDERIGTMFQGENPILSISDVATRGGTPRGQVFGGMTDEMQQALAATAQRVYDDLGWRTVITSGFRTRSANEGVGAANSPHIHGRAVDVNFIDNNGQFVNSTNPRFRAMAQQFGNIGASYGLRHHVYRDSRGRNVYWHFEKEDGQRNNFGLVNSVERGRQGIINHFRRPQVATEPWLENDDSSYTTTPTNIPNRTPSVARPYTQGAVTRPNVYQDNNESYNIPTFSTPRQSTSPDPIVIQQGGRPDFNVTAYGVFDSNVTEESSRQAGYIAGRITAQHIISNRDKNKSIPTPTHNTGNAVTQTGGA